jgi:hypothetical protein
LYKPSQGWEIAMQMIGFIAFFVGGVAAVTGVSVSLYAALPKAVLAYAERHGRFQGLAAGERLANGTRASEPPAGRRQRLTVGFDSSSLCRE